MGAFDVLTPPNPLAPVKPDALWAHTPEQWLNDIVVLILLGLIFLAIAGLRRYLRRPRSQPGRVLELAEELRVRTPILEAIRVLQE